MLQDQRKCQVQEEPLLVPSWTSSFLQAVLRALWTHLCQVHTPPCGSLAQSMHPTPWQQAGKGCSHAHHRIGTECWQRWPFPWALLSTNAPHSSVPRIFSQYWYLLNQFQPEISSICVAHWHRDVHLWSVESLHVYVLCLHQLLKDIRFLLNSGGFTLWQPRRLEWGHLVLPFH